jgi:hypothetical protein
VRSPRRSCHNTLVEGGEEAVRSPGKEMRQHTRRGRSFGDALVGGASEARSLEMASLEIEDRWN